MKSIDLNCDMGEIPQAVADGTQELLMAFLTFCKHCLRRSCRR